MIFQAPNFNKKEEMFSYLCDYQVPVLRATWFIKLSSAYTVAVSEQKIKKRQLPDQTQGTFYHLSCTASMVLIYLSFTEWTSTLLKFMKEQLLKLQNHYQNQPSNVIATVQPGALSPAEEQRIAMKQWQYCTLLAKHMYQVSLPIIGHESSLCSSLIYAFSGGFTRKARSSSMDTRSIRTFEINRSGRWLTSFVLIIDVAILTRIRSI